MFKFNFIFEKLSLILREIFFAFRRLNLTYIVMIIVFVINLSNLKEFNLLNEH